MIFTRQLIGFWDRHSWENFIQYLTTEILQWHLQNYGLYDQEILECERNRTVLPNSLVDLKDKLQQGTSTYTACEHEHVSFECPPDTYIEVLEAEYTRKDEKTCGQWRKPDHCDSPRALSIVRERCNEKQKCYIKAAYEELGDPCPGFFKYLQVKYTCLPVPDQFTRSELACEGNKIDISCPEKSYIVVQGAFYGRDNKETCPSNLNTNTKCSASSATEILKNSCNLKSSCTLFANSSVFGDPCPWTNKYLHVDYHCAEDSLQNAVNFNSKKYDKLEEVTVYENNTMILKCPSGSHILVSEAGLFGGGKDVNCRSNSSLDIVNRLCKYKNECEVRADNTVFSNLCSGTIKYLNVKYFCAKVFKKRNVFLREVSAGHQTQISCPFGSSLKILDTMYGHLRSPSNVNDWTKNCYSDTALDIISARCDHKTTCKISAENAVFGDPCMGNPKYASVDYRCVEDQSNHVVACEHSALELDCPEGSLIRILKAFYGRSHPFICNNSPTPKWPKGCSSPTAMSELFKTCEGRRYCSIAAENTVFGEICNGTEKYLEVDYTCDKIELNKNEPLINVTFYLKDFTSATSTNFVIQKKKSDQTEWQTVLDGYTLDLGVPRSITGLKTGTAYDIRVIRKDLIDSSKCQSFVRVTTWPSKDIK